MMKALLFTLLFGIAAAAVVRVDQQVLHKSEETQLQGESKVEDYLKNLFENLVDKVKDAVDKVKDSGDKIFDKVEELKEKLKELGENAKTKSKEAVERLKEKVHDVVKSIQENLKKQITAVKNEVEESTYSKVKGLLTSVKEKISARIDAIRKYLKDTTETSETGKELDKLLQQLKDSDLADIFNNFLDLSGHEIRHLKNLYEQLKTLSERTDGVLKEKINNLLSYVNKVYSNGLAKLVTRYQNLKANLLSIVDETKEFSVDAVKEALAHLKNYRDHLGDSYDKLVESLKKVINKY